MTVAPQAVLQYWFAEALTDPGLARERQGFWFGSGADVDEDIHRRFADTHRDAAAGRLRSWTRTGRDTLALVLVLDQFSRNLFRGSPAAFAQDRAALELAESAMAQGFDRDLHTLECAFLYMPFQHAEDAALQARSVALYNQLLERSPPDFAGIVENNYRFALEHQAIIDRFGRFPHRNNILGRESSAVEREYLQSGGKTFGQT